MKLLILFLIPQFCCTYSAVITNGKCQHPCINERSCEVNQLSGTCYYVFNDKERTWDENKQLCASHNLTMIKVTKEMIHKGITIPVDLTSQDYVWLGGMAKELTAWTFVNGVPLNETYFTKPSDFKDGQELEVCGTVREDMTNDKLDCHNKKNFICRFDDWQSIPNVYISEASVDWFEARSRCIDLGGDLFYLNRGEDGKFLEYKLSLPKDRTFFIGLNKRFWQWEDGSHILHFNWMTNEPNNFDEKCLAMYAKEGSWIDWDCTLLNYGLCEGSPTESSAPTVMPPACESESCGNGGLIAAFIIFFLIAIVLAIALAYIKKDRILQEYQKLRKTKQEAETEGNEVPLIDSKDSTEVKTLKKRIQELEDQLKTKDQTITELERQVFLLTEEKKQQYKQLKGKTEQQIKWLNNENEQLDNQLKLLSNNSEETIKKQKEENEQQIDKMRQDHQTQMRKQEEDIKREVNGLNDKNAKDKYVNMKKEEYKKKKEAMEKEHKQQIQDLKVSKNQKGLSEQQIKEINEKIKKTDQEWMNEYQKLKGERQVVFSLENKSKWEEHLKYFEREKNQMLHDLASLHADQLKMLMEQHQRTLKSFNDQNEREKHLIEKQIKDNNDEIAILRKENRQTGGKKQISKSMDA